MNKSPRLEIIDGHLCRPAASRFTTEGARRWSGAAALALALLCATSAHAGESSAAASGSAAVQQPSTPQPSSRQFRGFLEYSPRVAQYQSALAPVIAPLEGLVPGTTLSAEKSAAVRGAITTADSMMRSSDRTFQDELLFLSGFAYELLGDQHKAAERYQRSLALKSTNPLVLFRHAVTLKKLNRCTDAVATLREVAWEAKSFAYESYYLIGECYDTLGKPADAKLAYDKAYTQNPKFVPVLKKMVAAEKAEYEKTADPRKRAALEVKLLKDFDALAEAGANDRDTLMMLASLLVNNGDPLLHSDNLKRGLKLSQELCQRSGYKDEGAVHLLFEAYRKSGDLQNAQKAVTQGLAAVPASTVLKDDARQIELDQSMQLQPPA